MNKLISLFVLGWTFLKAEWRFYRRRLRSGDAYIEPEETTRRLAVCSTCSYRLVPPHNSLANLASRTAAKLHLPFNCDARCKECGCCLRMKAQRLTETCPFNLWPGDDVRNGAPLLVACNQCQQMFDPNEAGLAFNVGYGTVYVCRRCHPPATAEQGLRTMVDFIAGAEEHTRQNPKE